jgi:hypothetical protein
MNVNTYKCTQVRSIHGYVTLTIPFDSELTNVNFYGDIIGCVPDTDNNDRQWIFRSINDRIDSRFLRSNLAVGDDQQNVVLNNKRDTYTLRPSVKTRRSFVTCSGYT